MGDQRVTVVSGEWREVDAQAYQPARGICRALPPLRMVLEEAGARQADNEQGGVMHGADEMVDQIQGAFISPVDVFQQNDGGSPMSERAHIFHQIGPRRRAESVAT